MMKKIILFIFVFIFISVGVGIVSTCNYTTEFLDDIFKEANSLYQQEEYAQAIAAYTEFLNKGYESGALYYNLGNAYYKQGELAQSILFYEKARRLIPADADLESNLGYVRSLMPVSYEPPKTNFILGLLMSIFGKFGLNKLFLCIFVLNFILFFLLTASLFFSKFRRYCFYFEIGILSLLAMSAYYFWGQVNLLNKEAVIMPEEISARFEPQDNATVHFEIYAGEKVTIVSEKDGWAKIKRLDGKIGWMQKSDLGII